jgi:hypothetical protein
LKRRDPSVKEADNRRHALPTLFMPAKKKKSRMNASILPAVESMETAHHFPPGGCVRLTIYPGLAERKPRRVMAGDLFMKINLIFRPFISSKADQVDLCLPLSSGCALHLNAVQSDVPLAWRSHTGAIKERGRSRWKELKKTRAVKWNEVEPKDALLDSRH